MPADGSTGSVQLELARPSRIGIIDVREGKLTCAVHGASFRVESGACVGGPARSGLVPLPVRVFDGAVWLGTEGDDHPPPE